MIKKFAIFATIAAVIGAGLFFQVILDALVGMTVLEMLQQIVGFVLHVIVVSILGYGVYFAIELAMPIVKTFQQKQRHQRRQIRGRRSGARSAAPAQSKRRDNALLWMLVQHLGRDYEAQQKQRKS